MGKQNLKRIFELAKESQRKTDEDMLTKLAQATKSKPVNGFYWVSHDDVDKLPSDFCKVSIDKQKLLSLLNVDKISNIELSFLSLVSLGAKSKLIKSALIGYSPRRKCYLVIDDKTKSIIGDMNFFNFLKKWEM